MLACGKIPGYTGHEDPFLNVLAASHPHGFVPGGWLVARVGGFTD